MSRISLAVVFTAILAASMWGCAGSQERAQQDSAQQLPEGGQELIFSLQDITCRSCGADALTALDGREGIYYASFDAELAEVTLGLDPTVVDPEALREELDAAMDFGVVVGPGQGSYTESVVFALEMDVSWASRQGEDVDLTAHVVPGKVTVFDFYADWCGPCKDVDREMLAVLEVHDDVALRKVNIVDWDTPVAARYLQGVPELPYVIVYGVDGDEVARISGLDLDALRDSIEAGRAP